MFNWFKKKKPQPTFVSNAEKRRYEYSQRRRDVRRRNDDYDAINPPVVIPVFVPHSYEASRSEPAFEGGGGSFGGGGASGSWDSPSSSSSDSSSYSSSDSGGSFSSGGGD